MEICGEHGEEIAYSKMTSWDPCPACKQIEELKEDHDSEINDLQHKIDILEETISNAS